MQYELAVRELGAGLKACACREAEFEMLLLRSEAYCSISKQLREIPAAQVGSGRKAAVVAAAAAATSAAWQRMWCPHNVLPCMQGALNAAAPNRPNNLG